MKKRLLVILLALAATLCLAFALSACAPAPNDNAGDNGAQNENTEEIKSTAGLEYKPNDGNETYTCTGLGTATSTDIIIASKVNGKPVTAIGDGAFENCTTLTSVTIPDSVTSVGYDAFLGCVKLIQTQDGADYVDKWVVDCGGGVTAVTLKDDTRGIADLAFLGCRSLTEITIPDGVVSVGNSAFMNCTSLTSVNFGNGGKLKTIGKNAFDSCLDLTSITIPDGVTSICDGAFKDCLNLTEITIPDGITSIGCQTFCHCENLDNITIPASVTSIGKLAFELCSGLMGVYITDLTAWCNIEFDLSNPLEYAGELYLNGEPVNEITADMLRGVTVIKDYAFYCCIGLESVTIPDSVTSIGYSAFADCDNLSSVTFENKTGWQVSENENMSGAIAVNVDDAQNNSKLFRDILGASVSYYNYYWKRVG